jgi:hypothetical protein
MLLGGILAHLLRFPLITTTFEVLQNCLKSCGSKFVDFLEEIWTRKDAASFKPKSRNGQTLPLHQPNCTFSSHQDDLTDKNENKNADEFILTHCWDISRVPQNLAFSMVAIFQPL